MNKPWITNGILISIRVKQKLYKTHFLNGTKTQIDHYKKYANLLCKLKQISKKLHLEEEIKHACHDLRKFWSIIKTLTPEKSQAKAPEVIDSEGTKTYRSKEMAEKFNSFFCNMEKN